MNLYKPRVMFDTHVTPGPVNVGGAASEVVHNYIYLGQNIQLGERNFKKKADRRFHLAWAVFGRLAKISRTSVP